MTNTLHTVVVFLSTYIPIISPFIVAVATVVLVWLTSKYVRLTKTIVDEMKATRDPSVYLDIEAPDLMFNLTVGNSGQKPAVNIRFSVEKDIKGLKYGKNETGIGSIPIINKGISYLPPGKILKWRAGLFSPSKNETQDNTLQVKIFFENEDGKEFERNVLIDMSLYDAVLFESYRDSSRDMAQAIKKLEGHRIPGSIIRNSSDLIGKKTCPMCGERIQSGAKKCPHCHELINDREDT